MFWRWKALINPWASLVFVTAALTAGLLHGHPGVGQYTLELVPVGIVFGQFLIVRRMVPRAWWWLLVSLVGAVVGLGFGGLYGRQLQDAIDGVQTGKVGLAPMGQGRSLEGYVAGVAAANAFLGLWLGLGQWLVLRQSYRRSYVWAAASATALVVWGLLSEAGGALGAAAGALAAGAITGVALQRLPTPVRDLDGTVAGEPVRAASSAKSPEDVSVTWATIGGTSLAVWYLFETLTSPMGQTLQGYYQFYLTEVFILAALTIGVARRSLTCTGVLLFYVVFRTVQASSGTGWAQVFGFRSALLEDAIIIVLGWQLWRILKARRSDRSPTLPATDAVTVTYATFWRRAAAAAIDLFVAVALLRGAMIALDFSTDLAIAARSGATSGTIAHDLLRQGLLELTSLVPWFYWAVMESCVLGATVGKFALRLRVQDLQGRGVSFDRASGRYWAKFLSALPLFAGFVLALFSTKRQTLHDRLAGCLVVASRRVATTAAATAAPVVTT